MKHNGTLTIAHSGSLSKAGYTFEGWNTAPDGSGVTYTSGQSISNYTVGHMTLYAKWKLNSAPPKENISLSVNESGTVLNAVDLSWNRPSNPSQFVRIEVLNNGVVVDKITDLSQTTYQYQLPDAPMEIALSEYNAILASSGSIALGAPGNDVRISTESPVGNETEAAVSSPITSDGAISEISALSTYNSDQQLNIKIRYVQANSFVLESNEAKYLIGWFINAPLFNNPTVAYKLKALDAIGSSRSFIIKQPEKKTYDLTVIGNNFNVSILKINGDSSATDVITDKKYDSVTKERTFTFAVNQIDTAVNYKVIFTATMASSKEISIKLSRKASIEPVANPIALRIATLLKKEGLTVNAYDYENTVASFLSWFPEKYKEKYIGSTYVTLKGQYRSITLEHWLTFAENGNGDNLTFYNILPPQIIDSIPLVPTYDPVLGLINAENKYQSQAVRTYFIENYRPYIAFTIPYYKNADPKVMEALDRIFCDDMMRAVFGLSLQEKKDAYFSNIVFGTVKGFIGSPAAVINGISEAPGALLALGELSIRYHFGSLKTKTDIERMLVVGAYEAAKEFYFLDPAEQSLAIGNAIGNAIATAPLAEGGVTAVSAYLKSTKYVDDVVRSAKAIAAKKLSELVAEAVETFLKNIKARNIITKNADEINDWWRTVKGYTKPPYKPGKTVLEFELDEAKKFVRVYDDVNSGMRGQWFMKAEDISGLTPKQIQNKFALPTEPKYVVDLELPAGAKIRVGEANPLFGFSGGGIQFDMMGQFIGDWVNPRLLP